MKSFVYEGLEFRPIRQLRKYEKDFKSISKRIYDIGITPKKWNINRFYEVAEKHGAGECDLFEIEGYGHITFIPAEKYLFEFR